jgi:hypothetical protein
MGLGLGPFELLLDLFIIALVVLWPWAMIQCLLKEPDSATKLCWIVVILFVPFFGALLYQLVRRPRRIREHGA